LKNLSASFLISFIYFIFSFLWILFSDKAILLFTNNYETLTEIQTYKGWLFITATSFFLYFLIDYAIKKNKKVTDEFENSFNTIASPIIIFNEDGKIISINKAFEKLTEYKIEDIKNIDNWIDKSFGKKAKEVKDKLHSLFNLQKISDNGIFYIKTKSGKILILHFNSAPYGIKDGRKTIITNALDITEVKEKEKILIQQSKMAAVGEILENIAHQWRQPLSTISTASTGVKLKKENNILDDNDLIESMTLINNSAQYLSKTIDDFRNFFKPSENKEFFKIEETFDKTIMIIGNKFKNEKINFIKNLADIKILNHNNALIQVFMNLFNNSKDAFIEINSTNKLIFIDSYKDKDNLIIEIKDNAGGIKDDILDKVFEPYFTTKHKSQGTGIGLYMTQEIIKKHMHGDIFVENYSFSYKNKKEYGAKFTIILPLEI